MTFYYTQEGEFIAVIRNMVSDQLPLGLLMEVKQNYKDYWITNLFEVASHDQHTYYLTLENANRELILQSDNMTGWTTFKKRIKP